MALALFGCVKHPASKRPARIRLRQIVLVPLFLTLEFNYLVPFCPQFPSSPSINLRSDLRTREHGQRITDALPQMRVRVGHIADQLLEQQRVGKLEQVRDQLDGCGGQQLVLEHLKRTKGSVRDFSASVASGPRADLEATRSTSSASVISIQRASRLGGMSAFL